MKKRVLSLIMVLCMLCSLLPSGVFAADIVDSGTCGDGLTWTLDSDGSLTISGSGEIMEYYSFAPTPWSSYSGSVKAIVLRNGVTSIGEYAFYNCSALESVTIPDSVKRIGIGAFYGCSSLESVTIPGSVTDIGSFAFYACRSLESMTIPDSVKRIGRYAFCDTPLYYKSVWEDGLLYMGNFLIEASEDIESVSIRPGTRVIAESAFRGCTRLASVSIPDSVISIGTDAFYDTSLYRNDNNWEDGMLYIGDCLIDADKDIVSADIKVGTRLIAGGAFKYAYDLISVTLPVSVMTVCTDAFLDCYDLEHLYYGGTKEQLRSVRIEEGNEDLFNFFISYNCRAHEHDYANGVCTLCGARDPEYRQSASAYFRLSSVPLNVDVSVTSKGRSSYCAGVSSVSQFTDEEGNFCFAVQKGENAVVYAVINGAAVHRFSAPIGEGILGTALCDSDGNYYLVRGRTNNGDDHSAETIFVSKYDPSGRLLATVAGNGSESGSGGSFNTRIPFHAGNCDAAISGRLLGVNYARQMYSGHQSNSLFTVDIDTMEKVNSFRYYNSHSFDQRIIASQRVDGFLLGSHGDAYDRNFTTSLANIRNGRVFEFNSFDFWVEEGAIDRYDMRQLNQTRARLGNVLETSCGIALIGSSARSLSEDVYNEPYDVFVQIFDPTMHASSESAYVTTGTRSGYAGPNGDQYVTNYGVKWLTDFGSSGKTADVIQAVGTDNDRIVVLYETGKYGDGETFYMVLGADGSVLKDSTLLGKVSLNRDEEPIYAGGTVQWIANDAAGKTVLYKLNIDFDPAEEPFTDIIDCNDSYRTSIQWAVKQGIANGYADATFRPNSTCTRGHVVTFLWRAAGSPEPQSPVDPFSDVAEASPYYKAILWAAEQGITSGYSDGTFRPNDACTRAHVVTFLWRYEGKPADVGEVKLSDLGGLNADFAAAIRWAAAKGVTTGYADGSFRPNAVCTRAHVITFLYRDFE